MKVLFVWCWNLNFKSLKNLRLYDEIKNNNTDDEYMQNDPDELGPKHLTDEILIENKIEETEDDLNDRIDVLRSDFFVKSDEIFFCEIKEENIFFKI